MKFLFFGDIIGQPGRQALTKIIPELKKKYEPDLIIANGENGAHGIGVNESSLKEILDAGVDFVTTGNHVFTGSKESITLLENKKWPMIRPANWSPQTVGDGYRIVEIRTKKVLIINLIGRVFMHRQHENPFKCADDILKEYCLLGAKKSGLDCEKVDAIIVDWHAEATSEKVALGWFLDGRVSAVFGTHIHVPTADARILPQGTGYISDVGMVGPRDSVLGLRKEEIINGFLTQMPQKTEIAEGEVEVNYIFLETDDATGLAKNIVKEKEIVI